MALLNYTTKKTPEETIAEIQKALSRFQMSAMMTEYEGRNVSAVSFKLAVDGKPLSFKLPCNWRGVREIMKSEPRVTGKLDTDDQAIRVAWRIIKDWIEAQLALVEINMVTLPQIFLPYAVMPDGRTLGEAISENPNMLLGNGN